MDHPENSLQANKQRIEEMFLAAQLTKPEMVTRIAAAETAERIYQQLAAQLGLDIKPFQQLAGYALNPSPDPLQIA